MKDVNSIADVDTITQVAIAELVLSDMNPRQTVTEEEIDFMADSIEATGLIQSLAGFDNGKTIEIVAGGRRLRALKQLAAEEGSVWAVATVPVKVTTDRAEAQAWASTENIARAELHPAEEIRAFSDMAKAGADEKKIATTFGVPMRRVQQRLKLAALPEAIIAALRADELTLDAAGAYTLTNDEDHALAVFEKLSKVYNGTEAWCIRRNLTEAKANGGGKLGKFVGREVYEAAGGTITTDLFEDETHFDDAALLTELATAKLAEAVKELEEEGWKWVESDLDEMDYRAFQTMGRTYAEPVGLSDDKQARLDELSEKVEYGEGTFEEEDEAEALQEKADKPGPFSGKQMAHAGVFVNIDYNGKLSIQKGLVKAEDIKGAVAAGVCKANLHGSNAPTEKPKYPNALREDMIRIRNAAVQRALLGKPELALDLLTFVLSSDAPAYMAPVAASVETMPNEPKGDMGLSEEERLKPTYGVRYSTASGTVETFEAFRKMPKKQRNALLTGAIARGVGTDLHGRGTKSAFVDLIAGIVAPNVRDYWTPNEDFFKRLKADQLDEVFTFVLGKAPNAETKKMKKAAKVAALTIWFEAPDEQDALNAEQKARVKAWHPEEMGFDPAE